MGGRTDAVLGGPQLSATVRVGQAVSADLALRSFMIFGRHSLPGTDLLPTLCTRQCGSS
jgi:hypothetical protein